MSRAADARRVEGRRAVDDGPLDAVGVAIQQGVDVQPARGDPHDAGTLRRDAFLDELGEQVRDALLRRRPELVAAPEAGQIRGQAMEGWESRHVLTPLPATLAGSMDEDDGGRARGP